MSYSLNELIWFQCPPLRSGDGQLDRTSLVPQQQGEEECEAGERPMPADRSCSALRGQGSEGCSDVGHTDHRQGDDQGKAQVEGRSYRGRRQEGDDADSHIPQVVVVELIASKPGIERWELVVTEHRVEQHELHGLLSASERRPRCTMPA